MKKNLLFFLVILVSVLYIAGHLVLAESPSEDSSGDDSKVSQESSDDSNDETVDQMSETEDETDSDDDSLSETADETDSDGDGVDDATEKEAKLIVDTNGARIRMKQLGYRIGEALARMDTVIKYLDEKGENVDDLKGIYQELLLISNEAATVNTANVNLSVEKFVSMKKDSIDLIKEFRENARGKLSDDDLKALNDKFKEIRKTEIERLKSEVKSLKRILNAQRVEGVLKSAGVDDPDLVQKIKDGRVSIEEAKKEIRAKYQSANEEERMKLREEFKKEIEDNKEAVKASVAKYVEARKEIIEKRVEERTKKLQKAASAFAKSRAEKLAATVNNE